MGQALFDVHIIEPANGYSLTLPSRPWKASSRAANGHMEAPPHFEHAVRAVRGQPG